MSKYPTTRKLLRRLTPYPTVEQMLKEMATPKTGIAAKCPVVKVLQTVEKRLSMFEWLVMTKKIKEPPKREEWDSLRDYLSALEIYERYHGDDVELKISKIDAKISLHMSGSMPASDRLAAALYDRKENGQSPVGSPINSPL
jgi:hypothetical protein